MKELQPECPLKDRCDAIFSEAIDSRVSYTRDLEDITRSRDYWQDQAFKALRALGEIAAMIDDYEDDGLPMHASVPEAVRKALGD
jgi:hypothetical protein